MRLEVHFKEVILVILYIYKIYLKLVSDRMNDKWNEWQNKIFIICISHTEFILLMETQC